MQGPDLALQSENFSLLSLPQPGEDPHRRVECEVDMVGPRGEIESTLPNKGSPGSSSVPPKNSSATLAFEARSSP